MNDGRTPSPIASSHESFRKYDSHESFGFQEARRKTYSLANSVSGPAARASDSHRPARPPLESEGFFSDIAMSSDPALNSAADMSMTSIALAEAAPPVNTTHILQRALESNPRRDPGIDFFTTLPPRGVRHADYNKHVDQFPDDIAAYIQVLIWCLSRRIEHLKKSQPANLRLALLLASVLKNFQHKLQARLAEPSTAYEEPTRLKPRMANPSNERYRAIQGQLQTAYDRVHATTRESYKIAGHFETLSAVGEPGPVEAPAPSSEFEQPLGEYNRALERQIVALLERVASIDGRAAQARETLYEQIELRDIEKPLPDPLTILQSTLPEL